MRDKQIEEMTNTLYENRPYKELWLEDAEDIAKVLYNAGYRKSSDVAREIFEEIEKSIANLEYKVNTPRKTVKVEELKAQVNWVLHEVVPNTIAELKKKYESEGEG